MLPLIFAACAPSEPAGTFESYDPAAEVAGKVTSAEQAAAEREHTTKTLDGPAEWVAPKGSHLVAFTAPTTGRWIYQGMDAGRVSGDAACRGLGATHVCSIAELEQADKVGVTARAPAGTKLWVALNVARQE